MRSRWPALLACCAIALSTPARAQQPAASDVDELRKLMPLFDFVRARNVRDYVISGPDVIDEGKYLKVGGIEQWVTIRGENRANPVVRRPFLDRLAMPAVMDRPSARHAGRHHHTSGRLGTSAGKLETSQGVPKRARSCRTTDSEMLSCATV
jgi:hypothetical protein